MQGKIEATLEAGPLRVTFLRVGDRVQHWIGYRSESDERPIAWSVEGTADEDWPKSPPFQSLHVERPADTAPRALLVGMAGQSHWSASIEADEAGQRIHFDIACRVRQAEIVRLGSEYLAIWSPTVEESSSVELTSQQLPGERLRIEPSRAVGPTRIKPTERGFVIAPCELTSSQSSRTLRWAYSLIVEQQWVR